MKRLIAIALAGLLSACAPLPTDGGTRFVRSEQEFTLSQGGRAEVPGSRLTVEFAGVPEDRRCAIEAQCVSAGHAVVRLLAALPGREPATLDVRTDAATPFAAYHDHAIVLVALDPARSPADSEPDYRVRLVVGPLFTGGE